MNLKNGWELTGYAHLNDNEIISDIIERPFQEETQEYDDSVNDVQTILHNSAVKTFEGRMQWLWEQGADNMTVLKEMRDLAARKCISTEENNTSLYHPNKLYSSFQSCTLLVMKKLCCKSYAFHYSEHFIRLNYPRKGLFRLVRVSLDN